MEDEYGYFNFNTDESKNKVTPCGKTVRELLQIVGTEMFRNLDNDVWINTWKKHVASMCPHYDIIVVSDVRFPNEVKAIQDMGGIVIRFTRAPFASNDTHPSETALDNFDGFDYVVDNSNMTILEQNEAVLDIVEQHVNKKKYYYLAHPFDFRFEARKWEERVESQYDVHIMNPFYDTERTDVVGIDEGREGRYEKLIPQQIVSHDVGLIEKSKGCIAFVTGDLSYGTIMEIVYAYRSNIPVYIVCTNGHETHPWLAYHATKVFTSTQDLEQFLFVKE